VRIACRPGSVQAPAQAVLDRTATLPGRGAYVCRGQAPGQPAGECLAGALANRGIARTLRRSLPIDPELIKSVSR
jgi:predicted RNA-binding protein YlxR (DUF448 family)